MDVIKENIKQLSLDSLVEVLKITAQKQYDGHFTIMSFTTGYKVAFGTPNLRAGDGDKELSNIPPSKDMKEAIINCIFDNIRFQ